MTARRGDNALRAKCYNAVHLITRKGLCRLWVIRNRFGRDRLSTNVRFASIPTVNSGLWDLSRCARSRHNAAQQPTNLLDHLVGGYEQAGWHCEAKRLGGLEIDHEFKLGGLLDR